MREVTVGKLTFGMGQMKICVPVCAATLPEALTEIQAIQKSPADLIEWRVDYFTEDILMAAPAIHSAAGELPVLGTFRTKREGGEREIGAAEYFALNLALGKLGVPMLDLELKMCQENQQLAQETIAALHGMGAKLVISSHDFEKTPPRQELLERYRAMREDFDGDLPKIAVMPNIPRDVMCLLSAMTEAAPNCGPLIGISMGELGKMTRVRGGAFGSVLTFATVGKASAPGQFSAEELAELLSGHAGHHDHDHHGHHHGHGHHH